MKALCWALGLGIWSLADFAACMFEGSVLGKGAVWGSLLVWDPKLGDYSINFLFGTRSLDPIARGGVQCTSRT